MAGLNTIQGTERSIHSILSDGDGINRFGHMKRAEMRIVFNQRIR